MPEQTLDEIEKEIIDEARELRPEDFDDGANLEECARFFSFTTNTVKKWPVEGCPCEQIGGQGKQYVFRLRKVAAWRKRLKEEEAELAAARAAQHDQLALELGYTKVEMGTEPGQFSLKDLAEAQRIEKEQLLLAQRQGRLVDVEALSLALMALNTRTKHRLRQVPFELGEELGWSDETRNLCQDRFDDILENLANELTALIEQEQEEAKNAALQA